MIVAPNSPSPRANATAAPATESSRSKREGDAPEGLCRPGAKRARGVQHRSVDGFEGRDCRADVERARDERDREDDGDLRESDRDPQRVELLAEEPEAAERDEQAEPRDGRRQHERQLDDRDDQCPTGEATGGEEIRRRRPDPQDQHHRDRIRLQCHAKRIAGNITPEPVDRLRKPDLPEDRNDRQSQEDHRDRDREEEQRAEALPTGRPEPAHWRPKPACLSSERARTFVRILRIQARAAVLFRLELTTAIS